MRFNTGLIAAALGLSDLQIITEHDTKDEVIATYTSEFKGTDYFNIRKLYVDRRTGEWAFGKGLSVPAEEGVDLISSLAAAHLDPAFGTKAA